MSILYKIIPKYFMKFVDFFLCVKSNKSPDDNNPPPVIIEEEEEEEEDVETTVVNKKKSTKRPVEEKIQEVECVSELQNRSPQRERIYIYKNLRDHLPPKQDQFFYNKIYGDLEVIGAFEDFLATDTIVMDSETFQLNPDRKKYPVIENYPYFRDRKRRIDYILTFETAKLQSPVELQFIQEYIRQLELFKLQFELEVGHGDKIVFIKIHIPYDVLWTYSKFYNLSLNNPSRKTLEYKRKCTFFIPNVKKYKTIDGESSVSSERIWVIYKLLCNVKFGKFDLFSINRMLHEGYFNEAYPLHDGTNKWSKTGPYNIRQILSKHWSSLSNMFMEQPLHLVKKYYSFEVGFYFVWYGFYNVMLIPASIVGIICFALSLTSIRYRIGRIENEICKSSKFMCPHSCVAPNKCVYEKLSYYCAYAKMTDLLVEDHWSTVFAIFMCIWASVFVALWNRKQNNFSLKWIAETTDISHKERAEFKQRTKYRKISEVTQKYEPYIPTRIKVKNTIIVYVLSIFVIGVVLLAICAIFVMKVYFILFIVDTKTRRFKDQLVLITEVFSSILQVIAIKLFKIIFSPICIKLTHMENPRTQDEFNQSVLHKLFLLNCVNYYTPLLNLAFVEQTMAEFPGDLHNSNIFYATSSPPVGKILPVAVQLFSLLLFKAVLGNFFSYMMLEIKKIFKRKKRKGKLPQWEEDYLLESSQTFMMTGEMTEMVIQFGLITFFSGAFMLAPLCALINNVMELRSDAIKINTKYKRPVPVRVQGIGAWNNVIRIVSYMAIVVNAFVIAFATPFIPKKYYHIIHGTLDGYTATTLSEFKISDMHPGYRKRMELQNITVCYYTSQRYGPDHKFKYKFTSDYSAQRTYKFALVLVFQHVLLIIHTCISYVIPSVPLSVKMLMNKERIATKEMEMLYTKDKIEYEIPRRKRK